MFGREDHAIDFKDVETVIGPSVKVEGNFSCAGDIVVEGTVVGMLHTTKNLRIGDHAKVRADIEADNVLIAGEVHGNITATGTLQLLATGKIIGNVTVGRISIETGAVLQGKCQMTTKTSGTQGENGNDNGASVAEHEKKTNRKEKDRQI